jgi:hypothetical protein
LQRSIYAGNLPEWRSRVSCACKYENVDSQIEDYQKKLDDLVKKFVEADFMAVGNRRPFQGFFEAIRFQQGEHETVRFSPSTSTDPLIRKLVSEIIETTKVKRWLPNNQAIKIPEKKNIKRVESCMSSDLAVAFEQLKIK